MPYTNETSRREFLAWSAALAAGAGSCRAPQSPASSPSLSSNDLIELSATDAVRAMREGELKAEDYAAALLERAEAGKHLNAFITLDTDRVLEAARAADRRREAGDATGALHGLPMPIKDSVNTQDLPTTGGTPALREFTPKEDAPVIRTLREAGAIVMGKTNLHELSWGWSSNNLAFGAVRNPYDPTRIPGGSSGGTSAAVAARMSPLGLAEDTEGSIRVPAALCGIFGFRPTTGRYPSTGVLPITTLFDQVGPHARTVTDLVLFDAVFTSDEATLAPASLQGVRLGIDRAYDFVTLDPEVDRVTREAMRKLEEAGAVLVEAEVPDLAKLTALTAEPIQIHDVVPMLTQYLQEFEVGISFEEMFASASIDIKNNFELYTLPGAPSGVSDETYREAKDVHLPALRETLRAYYADNRSTQGCFRRRSFLQSRSTRAPTTPSSRSAARLSASTRRCPETSHRVARRVSPASCYRLGSATKACRYPLSWMVLPETIVRFSRSVLRSRRYWDPYQRRGLTARARVNNLNHAHSMDRSHHPRQLHGSRRR